ncbi:hypothetical protein [Polaromonas sp.]|uniref:hypothetical protein n=1 Tax=Polaromonas sp. TaxID=1869339 RepID=UPI002733D59A|nr:hypothetical protein [Polaromonas sp.]
MDLKDLGILGGALSAVIAALSYWAKTRHERRRATRTALYYLLEVHHLVRRLRVATNNLASQIVQDIRTALEERGSSIAEAEVASASEQLKPVMRDFMHAQLEELSTDIRDPFAKALADLAKEDPILAFRLRGRDRLLLLSQNIDAIAAQASAQAVAIGNAERATPGPNVDGFLLDATVSELEHAVRATAWRCDIFTHLGVMLLLRRTAREETGDLRELVADMVKKVVSTGQLIPSQTRSGPP